MALMPFGANWFWVADDDMYTWERMVLRPIQPGIPSIGAQRTDTIRLDHLILRNEPWRKIPDVSGLSVMNRMRATAWRRKQKRDYHEDVLHDRQFTLCRNVNPFPSLRLNR